MINCPENASFGVFLGPSNVLPGKSAAFRSVEQQVVAIDRRRGRCKSALLDCFEDLFFHVLNTLGCVFGRWCQTNCFVSVSLQANAREL